ncbi:MAG: NifB/NifX family molybdenum-iron cluster-binding protein [Eubacteriales bacterium]|jgi:predicted Fe-Mo cluster-binding NifX family protein|nr:NifB/NifX family molybdenum-iron cluster-binding protein [Eubacteriales bacterium]MDD3572710.1 NifB/NifX family molybdenum-iron cluster-binding protein [Eubacteriales bacterium]MDD4134387.1 NifB/NifX family molybdenum-iron cluster-binding protein [Eubacteriales bacterium]NLO13736.1 dinitrogenase iron-molybdenum cofactor biosynthesis protein [Clostridiales bacterium]
MIIAIPVSGKGQNPAVATSFGRAAHFLMYDDETGQYKILENAAMGSTGGAGIQAAQAIVDSGAEMLLTPQCGNNAAKVLAAAGLRIYKTDPGLSAMENLKAFRDNELEELRDIHEGYHGH